MTHALILNASFEPLQIVTWQKAVQLLYQGKVEVLEESDHEIRTVKFAMKIPSVLRLNHYVAIKKRKHLIRFSRTNVFLRDQYQCQYCSRTPSKSQLTLDHIVPIVQGGQKDWENIVTACMQCNQKKGGRTPAQAGLQLLKRPTKPQWLPYSFIEFTFAFTPERWNIYLKVDKNREPLDQICP